VFYKSSRVGQHGKSFRMIKFSTMKKDSAKSGNIALKNDPRVFAFGRILRKAKINEIPQLLNIILGDMTFVGPRPLPRKHFDYYSKDQQKIIIKNKPGLTGIGSIVFRNETDIFNRSKLKPEDCYRQYISPYKAALERWYYEKRSTLVNIKIIFCTIWVVLAPKSQLVYHIFKDLPEQEKSL